VTVGASPSRPPAAPGQAVRSLARVTANQSVGGLVWLTLTVPGWPGGRPGQFALLQSEQSRCFLGRALSVAQQDGESVSFLIAPIGEGTRELCVVPEGRAVWVLGPLGNGFDLHGLTAGGGRVLVVGGGVGAAPFPLLLSALAPPGPAGGVAAAPGVSFPSPSDVVVLLGFRDAAQAAGAQPVLAAAQALDRRGMHCRVEIATEDGSLGRAERVSATLEREIRPDDHVAVCGPWAMTEAVALVCRSVPGVRVWFSLEAGMACGVGSCHGCVVPLAGGGTARVCHEGPVFSAEALFDEGLQPRAEVRQ
jgi:dihydroorotate dehydrogenase electron transfer subunit